LNECGAKKDRHANIGYGMIGFDNIISICYNDRVSNLPKILETPLSEKCNVHKMEVKMIRDKKFIDWNK
jgi:deoxyribonuclease-4